VAFAFEKLIVYQKAVAFADAVCTVTKGFPRGCFFLEDQLKPAAVSAAANFGEAARTKMDRNGPLGGRQNLIARKNIFRKFGRADLCAGHDRASSCMTRC